MDVFKWSTPGANIDGTIPKPWRVAKTDAAVEVMRGLGFGDAYAVHAGFEFRGAVQMHVGLYDGPVRRRALQAALSKAGFRTRMVNGELYWVDSVPKRGQ